MSDRVTRFLFASDSGYHSVDGAYCLWHDFLREFLASLSSFQQSQWDAQRVRKSLGSLHPVGRGPGNRLIVGNVAKGRARPRRYMLVRRNTVRLEP